MSDGMNEQRADGREQLVDELRTLLEAVASRAEEGLRGCAGSDEDARTSSPRWCPLCAAASVLRGERPELAQLLVERFAEVVALLRRYVAEHHSEAPEDAEQQPPAAKVQRIGVQRVNGRLREEREC